MCGIGGAAGTSLDNLMTGDAKDALRHRGPDGAGNLDLQGEGWGVSLSHTRLAINDLSDAGLQPFSHDATPLVMSFNGEIYNYAELRRSCEAFGYRFRSNMDGEVIIPLFEREGVECFKRLNGIFAIAIADQRTGELWLTRDRLGVKPLLYRREATRFFFASEPACLQEMSGQPLSVDETALAQYFTFLYVPHPRTRHREIRSLRPGEVLRWRQGDPLDIKPGPHTIAPPSRLLTPEPSVAQAELERLFGAAVRRQTLSDVPIGLMASGGVDSSLVWAAQPEAIARAFTAVPQGSDIEGFWEDASASRRLAAHYSTPLSDVVIPEETGAFAPRSGDLLADPSYLLANRIAQGARAEGIKVLFSGQGADECFAGYRRHQAYRWLEIARSFRGPLSRLLPVSDAFASGSVQREYGVRLVRAARSPDAFGAYYQLYSYSSAEERARLLDAHTSEVADAVVAEEHRRVWEGLPGPWSDLKKALVLDLLVYMPGINLAVTDRAGMSAGVEIRVPWLDDHVVDFSLSLDPSVMLTARDRKTLPVAMSRETLPRYVWDRPKRAFGVPTSTLPAEGSRRQSRYIAYAAACLDSGNLV